MDEVNFQIGGLCIKKIAVLNVCVWGGGRRGGSSKTFKA